jgi:hypothetical protein
LVRFQPGLPQSSKRVRQRCGGNTPAGQSPHPPKVPSKLTTEKATVYENVSSTLSLRGSNRKRRVGENPACRTLFNHVLIMPNEDNINLIQCGDDGWAPWSVVCIHLLNGSSREWVPLDSTNPEVDHDWLCPECVKKHDAGDHNLNEMRAVCIHCVRKVRAKLDPNYK